MRKRRDNCFPLVSGNGNQGTHSKDVLKGKNQ
jgi:hypothetical protein